MLEVRGLTIVYPDGVKAVDKVSFQLNDGASAALAGGNGAGKTSLLLALAGLLPARSGEIILDGKTLTPTGHTVARRQIGLVFQNPDDALFMPRVLDDVMFGPLNQGLSREQARAKASNTLALLGMEGFENRSPLRLSGGEKRMIGLAAVLAMDPSILLLDEPTAFLDPKARRRLASVLLALPQAKLIATHDLSFAADLCSEAILLKRGSVFACGRCDTLFQNKAIMDECEL